MILFSSDWWNALSGAQQVFWTISIVFSVLFVIQFVLSLLGMDLDHDVDVDIDTGMDVDMDGGDVGVDADFALFSVRGFVAFFTFFGWTGVLALNAGSGTWMAVGFATVAGFVAMFVVGYMLYLFSKLNQEGNVDVKEAVFQIGEVYLPIPPAKNGQGKVHLQVGSGLREFDAITEGKQLATGTKIRVVEVIEEDVLLVEPIQQFLTE